MKAIILSAGQGSRLLPLTESVPKCCLKLDGKSLLQHQIESLAANGMDDIVVVTGFNHQVVEELVGEINIPGISIRTLFNPFYAVSDNLGTTWIARKEMGSPFLLLNGDTLFEESTLSELLHSERVYPITLAIDRKDRYDDDDMKISAEGEQLRRVGKRLESEIVNGESIGMMVFNHSGAKAFVQKIESLMSSPGGLAQWYLSAIDELADTGIVGISSIQGFDWCEVDDIVDFKHAEKAVANWRNWSMVVNSRLSDQRQRKRKIAA